MAHATTERHDRQSASAPPLTLASDVTDHLKEIRVLKRRVQVGLFGAVYSLALLFYFLLQARALNLLIAASLAILLAITALELSFHRALRLSKRSAYTRPIILRMLDMETADSAHHGALDICVRLLHLRAAFVALRHNHGDLTVAASLGLDLPAADRVLRLGLLAARQALETGVPIILQGTLPTLADTALRRGDTLAFVPITALEKPLGVLALMGPRDKADLKDIPLLRDMGLALGISLENLRQKEELREMATIDELTQVYNRRYFFEQLERQIAEARRYNGRLAILLVDFDDLKAINDRHGHGAGDEALRAVTRCLMRHSRAADIVARLGGDEFALILPRSSYQGAREMADRLCQAVASQPLDLAEGGAGPMAISYGIAAFPEDAQDIESLLRQADAHMYETKRAKRRDQVSPAP